MVSIKLDTHRNALITVEMVLTAFTAALAIVTAISGIFGMNLHSGLETVRVKGVEVAVQRKGLFLCGFMPVYLIPIETASVHAWQLVRTIFMLF